MQHQTAEAVCLNPQTTTSFLLHLVLDGFYRSSQLSLLFFVDFWLGWSEAVRIPAPPKALFLLRSGRPLGVRDFPVISYLLSSGPFSHSFPIVLRFAFSSCHLRAAILTVSEAEWSVAVGSIGWNFPQSSNSRILPMFPATCSFDHVRSTTCFDYRQDLLHLF